MLGCLPNPSYHLTTVVDGKIVLHYNYYKGIDMEKANLNIQIDADIKELATDEQIIAMAMGSPSQKVELTADEHGNIFVDKNMHPEIYDWATNG